MTKYTSILKQTYYTTIISSKNAIVLGDFTEL